MLTLPGGAVERWTSRARTSPPPQPQHQVPRSAINRRLTGSTAPVVVVVGPGGAGKSTAVASWAADVQGPIAWLRLRPGDEERLGDLVQLAIADAAADWPADLPGDDDPTMLVLDDVHALDPTAAGEQLEDLLLNLAPGIRLVIISRRAPPVSLHRLRLWGGVEEIGATDLRFSADDVTALATASGTPLGQVDLDLLHEATGGWPGAVRLALLRLDEERVTVERAAADAVTAMLEAELTDPALVALVDIAAVLGAVPDELLDTVVGTDTTELVARVEAASPGLLVHLGPRQVALDPMIADAVRSRATIDHRLATFDVLRVAARWHAGRGDAETALELLLAAQDVEGARHLADRALRFHFEGRTRDLRRMLEDVAPMAITGGPGPSLVLAGAFAIVGRADDGARITAATADDVRGKPELLVGVDLVLSRCHQVWGEPDLALEHLHRALDALVPAQDPLIADARLHLQLMALHLDRDDGRAARDAYLAAPAMAPSYGRLDTVLVPGALARAELLDGSLDAAHEAATRSLHAARQLGLTEGEHLADARRVLGEVALERDQADAVEQLTLALRHARTSGQVLATCDAACALARAQHAAGQLDDARATIDSARQPLHARALPARARAAVDVTDARLRLVAGDAQGAADLIAGLPSDHRCRPVLEAWQAILAGAPNRAIALLDALARPLPSDLELDRALLLARAASMVGTVEEAVEHVRRAVAIGWSDRRVRTFAEHGATIESLLRRVRDGGRSSAYVRTLLDAMPAGPAPEVRTTLAADLTTRERDVLRRLASNLSNQEIAGMLDISLNTLKSHVKSIYRKLDVENRQEAIELTRRFRLDDDPPPR